MTILGNKYSLAQGITPPPRFFSPAEEEIWNLRSEGKNAAALQICIEQAKENKESLVFPKLACDLCLSMGNVEQAGQWLLELLLRMWRGGPNVFADFAKRFQKIVYRLEPDPRAHFQQRLREMLEQNRVNIYFAPHCWNLLNRSNNAAPLARHQPKDTLKHQRLSLNSKISSDKAVAQSLSHVTLSPKQLFLQANAIERSDPTKLEHFVENTPRDILYSEKNKQLFDFVIAFLERREKFDRAYILLKDHPIVKNPSPRSPSLVHASFLRVCRKLEQFEQIQEFLKSNPNIPKTDNFNVLYELVYYYEAQKDLQRAREILERTEKLFPAQQPILATLRNFYLRFGMFQDASRIDARLSDLRKGSKQPRKYEEAAAESQAEVYSNLEHQRQLAALSDVTNGISHELGQPITNIRYTIQLFRRQLEREMKSEVVFTVFDTILRETERMGGLVKRLAPITSSRRVIENFDAVSRIKETVESARARLEVHQIRVDVKTSGSIPMSIDPVRFDQIVSNLLLNAIDAISELPSKSDSCIKISLSIVGGRRLRLVFEDNGPGISPENRQKIFEPFFSTKSPGKGEGLGLFIVWNLLKMQGGSISVDSTYRGGARFVLILPTETKASSKLIEP
jgi:signal transduction histidine kinase